MRSRSSSPRLVLGCILGLVAIATPAFAETTHPYDAEQARLVELAERDGRRPEGMKPLLTLWSNSERASTTVTLRALERLYASKRLSADRRAYVGSLLARAKRRVGDLEGSNALVRELGFVTSWNVVGAFDNEGKAGFDQAMPPEEEPLEPPDLDARYPGKEHPVGYRAYPELTPYGYVSFDDVMRPNESACGYATTVVRSEREQTIALLVGAGGAIRVWWNGDVAFEDAKYRSPDPDRHAVMVRAQRGENRILVKVCTAEGPWGFYLRMADATGGLAKGLTVDRDATASVKTAPSKARLPSPPVLPLAALERAANRPNAPAAALEDLAFLLTSTGADDPAENRARELASQAAELAPTMARLELAWALTEHRSEAMHFADLASKTAPDHPRTKLMHAHLRRSGPTPEDALPFLDALPAEGIEAMEGALLRSDVLREMELPTAALALSKANAARGEQAAFWQRELADAYRIVGDADRAIASRKKAVELRWDDTGGRRALLSDALRRHDDASATQELDALTKLASTARELQYVATVYESLGRKEDALAMLDRAIGIVPEEPELHVLRGRMQLRLGKKEGAALALREALRLRPQDAETRELLEQITPEVRGDERYAVPTKTLLARRGEGNGYPLTILQDLTVNTVYDNGLGSSFRQTAVQIHDANGARQWRTYQIRFDPNAQRVQIRNARIHRANGRVLEATQTFEQPLGEPWYRIYYDTRALVVVFPELRPGDVVELQYRIDDIAPRNLFADYYGDLQLFETFVPVRNFEYVLITPESKKIFLHVPERPNVRRERKTAGGRAIERIRAENLPAIREEFGLPGMTEVASYLHVSTYKSWEDVGRWYWGLIRDQLYADEKLKRTVRDLVASAPDEKTKVERIYRWVIENTRYVGLEFGIHGYKPYRVPQIVRRGFGDCKDKASLLYTMLREAGIEAHFVLLRTRRNGNIESQPASLAVFDHAIAYVPSLDLYLDGTAESSGTTELPLEDQGVKVLHVWPTGSELRRTPVLPSERNRRSRRIELTLANDGSATIEGAEEVRGVEAPAYRRTYQAEGTRAERFERSSRALFPGLVLETLVFEGLADIETPVRYRYRAKVPVMARPDGGMLRIAPSVLENLVRSMARTEKRSHPLELGGTSSYVEERIIHLPPGSAATQLPKGGEVKSDYGRLLVRIEKNGSQLSARTELDLARDRITPDEYPAFRQWIEEADRLLRERIGIGREER